MCADAASCVGAYCAIGLALALDAACAGGCNRFW